MIDPNLPLIDLHRHLDGSIRLETIIDLGRQHNLKLPAWDVESIRPFVQVTEPQPGVMAFIAKFEWMVGVLVDYAACARLVEAVIDGVSSARQDTGMKINLIGIISRTYGPDIASKEIEALLNCRDQFVALDLAGDEANFPGDLFEEQVNKARDAGWRVTVHAGESAGPESVWHAIQGLGAERIGHAVHAVDDPALMQFMAERRIGIEANLTSNVQTSTVPDYAHHPLRRFLELGLLGTINTDDPGISGIDLPYEYEVAAPAAGLSKAQIQQAQRNALEVAFLSAQEKFELVDQQRGASEL
jgi:adenosine deaminase